MSTPSRLTLSSGMGTPHTIDVDSSGFSYWQHVSNSNCFHRPDGSKKVYARLTPDVDALDIAATKLAIV